MSGQMITKTVVDGLRPGAAEYAVWDEKLPGFGVRVRPTGGKTFIVVYRAGTGRTAPSRRFTIGAVGKMTPDQARNQAKILLGAIAAGTDPAAEKRANRPDRGRLTFDRLAELYLDEYAKPRKSSWKNDESYLKRPRAKWRRRRAADITDDDVAGLIQEIGADAPVSANRTQSILHTLFAWAKEPGRKYVPSNPVAGMRQRFHESPRERVLSDDEIRTLWRGLDNPDLPASRAVALSLKFILATMVRPGQSAGAMVAEMVDLGGADPQYHIPKSRVKKRRDVIVPLNALAVSVAREAIRDDEQAAVFTAWRRSSVDPEAGTTGDPDAHAPAPPPLTRDALAAALNGRTAKGEKSARRGIREFLGMAHFTPHDLRRTAATVARRGGARREDVKALLDHLEGDVTATYDKYDMLSEKRGVAEILADELRKIVEPKPQEHPADPTPENNVVPFAEKLRAASK